MFLRNETDNSTQRKSEKSELLTFAAYLRAQAVEGCDPNSRGKGLGKTMATQTQTTQHRENCGACGFLETRASRSCLCRIPGTAIQSKLDPHACIERIYYAEEFSYIQINTRRTRQRVIKDLRRLKARLPVALKVEVEVREGSAFDEIVAVAKEMHADLIILATRGYTGLKHAFLGSTAERVVQHASCPVLVVPSGMG